MNRFFTRIIQSRIFGEISTPSTGQASVDARREALLSEKIAAQNAFDPDKLSDDLARINMRINHQVERFVRIEARVRALEEQTLAHESWVSEEINKLLDVINQSETKG